MPTQRRAVGAKGEGVSKAKIFKKESVNQNWTFQRDGARGEFKQKSNLWEESRHFLEQHTFHFREMLFNKWGQMIL